MRQLCAAGKGQVKTYEKQDPLPCRAQPRQPHGNPMFLVQLRTLYNFSACSIHVCCFLCLLKVRCAHVLWVMFKILEFPLPLSEGSSGRG